MLAKENITRKHEQASTSTVDQHIPKPTDVPTKIDEAKITNQKLEDMSECEDDDAPLM